MLNKVIVEIKDCVPASGDRSSAIVRVDNLSNRVKI
jgi:hypothetical protein